MRRIERKCGNCECCEEIGIADSADSIEELFDEEIAGITDSWCLHPEVDRGVCSMWEGCEYWKKKNGR